MLDWLISCDKEMLLFFNSVHTAWFDNFFWMLSAKWLNVFIAIPFIIILFHCRAKWDALFIILALALTVLLCDQIASSVFKPLFQRLRPTHDTSMMVNIVNGYTGGRYGFISSHAANAFGVATFLLYVFRNKFFTCAIFTWAVLVAFSRIYLGVHFPADILGGVLVGMCVGKVVFVLYSRLRVRLSNSKHLVTIENPYMLNGYAIFFAYSIVAVLLSVAVIAFF